MCHDKECESGNDIEARKNDTCVHVDNSVDLVDFFFIFPGKNDRGIQVIHRAGILGLRMVLDQSMADGGRTLRPLEDSTIQGQSSQGSIRGRRIGKYREHSRRNGGKRGRYQNVGI